MLKTNGASGEGGETPADQPDTRAISSRSQRDKSLTAVTVLQPERTDSKQQLMAAAADGDKGNEEENEEDGNDLDMLDDDENNDEKSAGKALGKKRANIIPQKLDEVAVREFIKANIKQRQCTKYVQQAQKPDYCLCGVPLSRHDESAKQLLHMIVQQQQVQQLLLQPHPESERKLSTTEPGQQKAKWDCNVNTVDVDPDSYGTILFEGYGQGASRKAPFVRVDHTISPEVLWSLLESKWNMTPPKLIISITGGAKRLNLKQRLENTFKRGLINAVTAADAWIVTGGTMSGVMELVGSAVRDYMLQTGGTEKRLIALGVASWGLVANSKALVSPDGEGQFPSPYKFKELTDVKEGKVSLDPFHTHFLLVDNGTEGKSGVEIKLRAALEAHIAEKCKGQVVLLVLEGGEQTLKTAAEAIERKTPVVVIKGSGRAADFIAFAFYKHKKLEGKAVSESVEQDFYNQLYTKAQNAFDWSKEKDNNMKQKRIMACIDSVKTILRNSKLLMVFHLEDSNTTNEIDQAILKVLLQAQHENAQEQLELALAWNCIEVAREDIFNMETRLSWQKVDLGAAMQTALIENKVDFVQLFLDSGVKLSRFLTVGRLEDLYQGVLNEMHSESAVDVFRNLVQEVEQSSGSCCLCGSSSVNDDVTITLHIVGEVIDRLTGIHRNIYEEYLQPVVKDIEEETNTADAAAAAAAATAAAEQLKLGEVNVAMEVVGDVNDEDDSGLAKKDDVELDDKEVLAQIAEEERRNRVVVNPERELFYWALLFARKDLAMMFWHMGRDHIGGALMASLLWKSLAEVADHEEELDLNQELEHNSKEFEEIATGVLNQCYQRDKTLAHLLCTRQLDLWASKTLFAIADDAEQMDFMEHSCCQTQLNKSWSGKLAQHTPMWKMILGLVFITLPFLKFSKTNVRSLLMDENNDGENNAAPEPPNHMYRVSLNGGGDTISIIEAIHYFLTAPLVKFSYYTISYIAYLGLFSYVLLTSLTSGVPTVAEYILWGWTTTLLLEEVRQLIAEDNTSMSVKLSTYFTSLWNVFDFVIYVLFITAIILRLTLTPAYFSWARMAYVLDLSMFFIRFLQVFFVEKSMGPKVIIIRGMLSDLFLFIIMLLIFIVNYGVASQALLYPQKTPSWQIILQPYLMIFGSFNIPEIQGTMVEGVDCTRNMTALKIDPTLIRCPDKTWLITVMFCAQLLLINILMLNLLIAMFSFTFSNIQTNSEKVWRYYRYSLIHEFYEKPALAPPLIVFTHIWRIMQHLYRTICQQKSPDNHFCRVLTMDENKKLTTFEKTSMENYMLRRQRELQEHIDYKVSNTSERIEKVIEDLELLREQFQDQRVGSSLQQEPAGSVNTSSVSLRPAGQSQVTVSDAQREISAIGERLKRQETLMMQVIDLLQGNKGGNTPRVVQPAAAGSTTRTLPTVSS